MALLPWIVLVLVCGLVFILVRLQVKREPVIENGDLGLSNFTPRQSPTDCELFRMPCFSNQDCAFTCTPGFNCSGDSNAGVCVAGDSPDDGGDSVVCNEKHGLLRILQYDDVTGEAKFVCRSILAPYVYDDFDNLLPSYCSHGTVDFNFLVEDLDPRKCECPSDRIWYIDDNNVPKCIISIRTLPDWFLRAEVFERNTDKIKQLMDTYTKTRMLNADGKYAPSSDTFHRANIFETPFVTQDFPLDDINEDSS